MSRGRAWAFARGMPPKRPLLVRLLFLIATLLLAVEFACADTIAVKSAELLAEDEDFVLNAQFDFAFNPARRTLQHLPVFRVGVRARPSALVAVDAVRRCAIGSVSAVVYRSRQYHRPAGFSRSSSILREVERICRGRLRPVGAMHSSRVSPRWIGALSPRHVVTCRSKSTRWPRAIGRCNRTGIAGLTP
jgi:hypothetical protein